MFAAYFYAVHLNGFDFSDVSLQVRVSQPIVCGSWFWLCMRIALLADALIAFVAKPVARSESLSSRCLIFWVHRTLPWSVLMNSCTAFTCACQPAAVELWRISFWRELSLHCRTIDLDHSGIAWPFVDDRNSEICLIPGLQDVSLVTFFPDRVESPWCCFLW